MRLHRFYIEHDLKNKAQIEILDEAILHQMKNVFRLEKACPPLPRAAGDGRRGDRVIFFDGGGKDYECIVELLSKKEGKFVVEKISDVFIPEKKVTLYMSLIKKENFELVIEKATELGVSRIIPLITERVQKKNIDLARCRRIIKEASEQCGRGDLPEISEPITLEEVFKADVSGLIAFDMSGLGLNNLKLKTENSKLLIGPEGGWSDSELTLFREKNISLYSLGQTVLRAETAAIVATAFILN